MKPRSKKGLAFEAELGNRAVTEAWNPRWHEDMIPLWIQSHFVFSMIGGVNTNLTIIYTWLVVYLPPWKIYESDWIIIPTIGETNMFQTTNQYTMSLMVFTVIILASTWHHLDPRWEHRHHRHISTGSARPTRCESALHRTNRGHVDPCLEPTPARWCPSSLAKLVNISPITRVD